VRNPHRASKTSQVKASLARQSKDSQVKLNSLPDTRENCVVEQSSTLQFCLKYLKATRTLRVEMLCVCVCVCVVFLKSVVCGVFEKCGVWCF
jgi:t-SNARE complex subunit (syntaxin)